MSHLSIAFSADNLPADYSEADSSDGKQVKQKRWGNLMELECEQTIKPRWQNEDQAVAVIL